MTLKKLQSALLFYKHYRIPPAILSLLCCVIYRTNEDSIFAAVACKLISDAAIWYFITALNTEKLYYYYNLHLSKTLLAITFFITDILLLSIALWITHQFI